jgi:hypothetical protein
MTVLLVGIIPLSGQNRRFLLRGGKPNFLGITRHHNPNPSTLSCDELQGVEYNFAILNTTIEIGTVGYLDTSIALDLSARYLRGLHCAIWAAEEVLWDAQGTLESA